MKENDYDIINKSISGIFMTKETEKRILALDQRRRNRKRKMCQHIVSVAACAIFILFATNLFFYKSAKEQGFVVTVYASELGAEDEIQLYPGEKTLLQPVENPFGTTFLFELELPENYCYEREGTTMGNDHISTHGTTIYWNTEFSEEQRQDLQYELPDYMDSSIRIRIYDEQGEWVDTLILKMTKEDGNCFAELLYEK